MRRRIETFASYYLRFNPIFKSRLANVLEVKNWEYSKIKRKQNEAFLKVLRRATSHSAFYKKLYSDYGVDVNDIKSIEDIHRLPVISRNQIKNHISDILIGNPFFKTKGQTSGTSGTPLTVYRDYSSILTEGAYVWAQRHLFGFHPGMKMVSLRGDLGRDEMKRYDPYLNCLYLSSYNLREDYTSFYHSEIEGFKPQAILAYPSSVEVLANFFTAKGLTLHVPYIFTSSEQLYDHQRTKVEKIFNSKIVDWYGNAERTIAIEQRNDGFYYELPLYSFNEYEEDRTITTGLISSSFPLIRYEVNDVIKQKKGKSQFQIDSILGRQDDILLLPDGTRLGRLGRVFMEIEGLELAQVHQKVQESFVINLVVDEYFNEQSIEKIRAKLGKLAGSELRYDINYVRDQDIIRTKAGKYKLVINEIDRQTEKGQVTI
ncbi:MAG: hypothetical protein AAF944_00595 [Bacteroidota bacterium]